MVLRIEECSRRRRPLWRAPGEVALRAGLAALAVVLVLIPTLTASPQEEGGGPPPDAARALEDFEQIYAQALEFSKEADGMGLAMSWSAVFSSAVVAEHLRKLEAGEEGPTDSQAVVDRILARLRADLPGSPVPDLVRMVQIQDPGQRSQELLELLGRHPEDPRILTHTTLSLQQSGAVDQAAAAAEAFLARRPASTTAFGILANLARDNKTRQAEILQRWARAAPGDPELVQWWVQTDLSSRDPETTEWLFQKLLESRSRDSARLDACRRILSQGDPRHRDPARACIARYAADPEQPEAVRQKASRALVAMAAKDGDWSGLSDSLREMDAESRFVALSAAAGALEVPARCTERIALLRQALPLLDSEGTGGVAASLSHCDELPEAQELLLDLMRRTPSDSMHSLMQRWTSRVNGVYHGEVPSRAVELLEERLASEEPGGPDLFKALDVAYQVAGLEDRRFDLLERWHRTDPASMRDEHVMGLAGHLLMRDRGADAVDLLESALKHSFRRELAEAAWGVHLEESGAERAERFAAGLAADEPTSRSKTGHLLLARGALLRGDPVNAERSYWKALEGERLDRDVAAELLAAVGLAGDEAAVQATARRACGQTGGEGGGDPACAADLLRRAGLAGAAAGELPELTGEENPQELSRLAALARQAGDAEYEERALRVMMESDPLNLSGWQMLGALFERQGRVDDLVVLLAASREYFTPPPSGLARATGRALVEADPQRAVEVLLETRGALKSEDNYSRGWIDHELREAYRRLGEAPEATPPAAGTTAAEELTTEECREALAAREAEADGGDTAAAARVGMARLYGQGDCVARDLEAAVARLRPAAGAGEPGAAYALAVALLLRDGPAAGDRAIALLERSAARPNVLAMEMLAFLHATGALVPRDVEVAERWLAEAARHGSDGLTNLGREAREVDTVRPLIEAGAGALREASAGGDAAAAGFLAWLASLWLDSDMDAAGIAGLAQRAAEAGDARAMRVLQALHYGGDGVPEDHAQGLTWRRRCAEAGDSFCMMFLGNALLEGERAPRDPAAGLAWLRRAADTGNWWAVASLGNLYARGRAGFAPNPDEAAPWKRKLADLGDAEATGWLRFHGYLEAGAGLE